MTYTVIVAEDEELLLTNLVQKIQKADPDFQVAGTAQTGDQALALVEKLSPDLVITDIRMPVMDGISASYAIRKLEHPDAQNIPIIAITANTFAKDLERCRLAGMNEHLSKPLNIRQLISILSKFKK